MRKYYVWNATIKLIVTARNPMEACCEALSYCGFTESTEIPDHIISWPKWGVDEQGFRHINGSEVEMYDGGKLHSIMMQCPMWTPDSMMVLDRFDAMQREFDPFCEHGEDVEDE